MDLNPKLLEDRVKIGKVIWEQTDANIMTFACTYAILESLGPRVSWDQVLAAIFISHKMHDVNPHTKISEFSRDYGLTVKPDQELAVLHALDFSIPRAFFLSELYALGKARGIDYRRIDIAARIAILYNMPAKDRNACIVASLAAAAKWENRMRTYLLSVPSFPTSLSKANVTRFFARLLNARAKFE